MSLPATFCSLTRGVLPMASRTEFLSRDWRAGWLAVDISVLSFLKQLMERRRRSLSPVRRRQERPEVRLERSREQGRPGGVALAGPEFRQSPAMKAPQSFELLRDGTVGGSARVRADGHPQALAQQAGRGMIVEGIHSPGLQVGLGTHVEGHLALAQFLQQLGRLFHAHAMAQALRVQNVQGFADTGGAGGFTGMRGAV